MTTGVIAIWSSRYGLAFGLASVAWTWLLAVLAHGLAGFIRGESVLMFVAPMGQSLAAALLVTASCYVLRQGILLSGDSSSRLERKRARRLIHDTALQTLEAIALTADPRGRRPEQRLAKIAGMARSQASDLRTALTDPGDNTDALAAVRLAVGTVQKLGLEVRLCGGPCVAWSSAQRIMKHYGVRSAKPS
jgi:signal transduction histidine kinase